MTSISFRSSLRLLVALPLASLAQLAGAQGAGAAAARSIDARQAHYAEVAKKIWDLAELGYQETQSSALLQGELKAAGFKVEASVAGMPTAFVATAGSGSPIIAILAEYDALPGITQSTSAERDPIAEKAAGHACGHHLFGTGSVAAAIAVKEWLAQRGGQGTIRLYGTPAEEGGAGKVYMVREGFFKDVDVVLHWHASDANDASPWKSLANSSAKFRFRGVSAHAAGAPERGRSALDGVEAMDHMVNMMREHVPEETRIHYVITSGGSAPNVVPDFAEVFYYVRHPDPKQVAEIFDRVVKASEGAALGTGTKVDHEIIHAVYAVLPNDVLGRVMDRNLRQVGGVQYTAEERTFAEKIRATFAPNAPPVSQAGEIAKYGVKDAGGSTDVADVSWVVPTVGLESATWVPGTAAHSWQAIAAGGMSIGVKGMMVAAKSMAQTAIDLFSDPKLLAAAKAEYRERVGPNFVYTALIGNRAPPLDFRKK